MEVYFTKYKYTDDARKALAIVIEKKGGLMHLIESYNKAKAYENEKKRIFNEITQLYKKGMQKSEMSKHLSSDIVENSMIQSIMQQIELEIKNNEIDAEIKPRTIIGSILGTLIGASFGGTLWGLQMIYSGYIFYIFGIGLILNSYAFIKLFTKQSKNNIVVLLFTILSSMLAFFLGFYLYQIIGYLGSKNNR
ncbi:MAG: hypothetical protein L6262_08815 [Weeksellaceae bacterium]|nr:hypothetical protein [Weeksellaceae bacterium]